MKRGLFLLVAGIVACVLAVTLDANGQAKAPAVPVSSQPNLSGNNSFSGSNTFTGTNTFTRPVWIDAGTTIAGPLLVDAGINSGVANTDIGFSTLGRLESNAGQSTGRVFCGPMASDVSYGGCSVGQSSLDFSTAFIFSNGSNTVFNSPSGSTVSFRIANGDSQISYNSTQGVKMDSTDASGTPGAATINKPRGIVAVANGASSVVVTNNKVTSASLCIAVLQDNTDALYVRSCVPGTGSFTINLSGTTTAARKVGWIVINP